MKHFGPLTQMARKYACAFMRVWGAHLSKDDYAALSATQLYFKQNPHIKIAFKMPLFDAAQKNKLINLLVKELRLPDSFYRLAQVLLFHNRIELFENVLLLIQKLYEERHNIVHFSLSGSHELSGDMLLRIQRFLAYKTGQTILYTYKVDKALIGGVRAQSDLLLWECSIRQRLRVARRAIVSI